MPADIEKTEFYLLTVDSGDALYMRFGHTIVRVVDPSHKADYLLNWGMFNFDGPAFAWKFFRGILIYQLALSPFEKTLELYRDIEKRRMWQERINLTRAQKQKFMERIIWNARPENIHYPYHYFFNNCSTIVRDYFDELLKGKIKEKFNHDDTGLTYRHYTRRNLGLVPTVGSSLDVLLNRDVDHPITAWAEMFLPERLRSHLLTLPAYNDDGSPRADALPFLSDTKVLIDLPPGKVDIDMAQGGFQAISASMGILLLLGTGFFLRAPHSKKGELKVRLCLGFAAILWGFLAGVFGTVMTASWLLSAHTDLYHNANLWLFWPIDFLFCATGFNLFMKPLPHIRTNQILGQARLLALLHLGSAATMVALWAIGIIRQDVSHTSMYLVPPALILFIMIAAHQTFGFKGPSARGNSTKPRAII